MNGYMQVRENVLKGGLDVLSDETLRQQFMMYKSAVQHLNALRSELEAMRKDGRSDSLLYRDRSFSLAAEWNEVLLYELFFENLGKSTDDSGSLRQAITRHWSSLDDFFQDLIHLSRGRCAKWLVLSYESFCEQLYLYQVDARGTGILSHHSIILCLNLSEGAYSRDYGTHCRNQYVEMLLKSIDWKVLQLRFDRAREGLQPLRF